VALAAQLERVERWHDRRPPYAAGGGGALARQAAA
jgi:hypothetical protein